MLTVEGSVLCSTILEMCCTRVKWEEWEEERESMRESMGMVDMDLLIQNMQSEKLLKVDAISKWASQLSPVNEPFAVEIAHAIIELDDSSRSGHEYHGIVGRVEHEVRHVSQLEWLPGIDWWVGIGVTDCRVQTVIQSCSSIGSVDVDISCREVGGVDQQQSFLCIFQDGGKQSGDTELCIDGVEATIRSEVYEAQEPINAVEFPIEISDVAEGQIGEGLGVGDKDEAGQKGIEIPSLHLNIK